MPRPEGVDHVYMDALLVLQGWQICPCMHLHASAQTTRWLFRYLAHSAITGKCLQDPCLAICQCLDRAPGVGYIIAKSPSFCQLYTKGELNGWLITFGMTTRPWPPASLDVSTLSKQKVALNSSRVPCIPFVLVPGPDAIGSETAS